MNADARALAHEHADGWRDGYLEGYKKGLEDGRSHGYIDAKVRAHIAVQDMPDAVERVTTIVGKVKE